MIHFREVAGTEDEKMYWQILADVYQLPLPAEARPEETDDAK